MSPPAPDTDPPGALPRGTRLGEFELRRVLGMGGFGIVYLAFDHALEREVAIKEYMPSSLVGRTATQQLSLLSQAHADTFALGLRSFVNEARLLARFDHPSLVKVHRYWEQNATAYMAMPCYAGPNLHRVRQQRQAAPSEAWLRSLIDPLLGALQLLHDEGVYHRDISPDNIIVQPDGRPVLLDFGAARRVLGNQSMALTAILKPAYAPIEQYAEAGSVKQGPWTDLYALGATLHQQLLGQAPPPATARAVQDDMRPLAEQPLPGCTPAFLAAIDWMLRPRPADRPAHVGALREVLAGRASVPPAESPAWARTQILPAAAAAGTAQPTASTTSAPVQQDIDLAIHQTTEGPIDPPAALDTAYPPTIRVAPPAPPVDGASVSAIARAADDGPTWVVPRPQATAAALPAAGDTLSEGPGPRPGSGTAHPAARPAAARRVWLPAALAVAVLAGTGLLATRWISPATPPVAPPAADSGAVAPASPTLADAASATGPRAEADQAPASNATAASSQVARVDLPGAAPVPRTVAAGTAPPAATTSTATPAGSARPAAGTGASTTTAAAQRPPGSAESRSFPAMPALPPTAVATQAPAQLAEPMRPVTLAAPSLPSAAAPTTPTPAAMKPAATPAAADPMVQARVLSPSERCEGRALLALYTCIENQCNRMPELREHPECLKLRREQEQRSGAAKN